MAYTVFYSTLLGAAACRTTKHESGTGVTGPETACSNDFGVWWRFHRVDCLPFFVASARNAGKIFAGLL